MKTSKLWDDLAKNKFTNINDDFLSKFREPGMANNRLAAWDPFDKSMRYFKFLFFKEIQKKDEVFFDNYEKIGPTSLGNPIMMNAPNGLKLNLDHFFSVEEYSFLNAHLNFQKIEKILEIGAGFGRTAQALLALNSHVKNYTIIDIPEILKLSHAYLREVLDVHIFQKIKFINALDISHHDRTNFSYDLIINIDSFQEMPEQTVLYYYNNFINNANYFFSKNAICKYHPEVVGLYNISKEQLLDVFSLGLSRDVVDIFDERELEKARSKHEQQYCPKQFKIIAREPLGMFPYYLNVLYKRV